MEFFFPICAKLIFCFVACVCLFIIDYLFLIFALREILYLKNPDFCIGQFSIRTFLDEATQDSHGLRIT